MTSAGKWVLGLLLLVVGAVFVARTVSSDPGGSAATVKNNLPGAAVAGAAKDAKDAAAVEAAAKKKIASTIAGDLSCKKACVEVNEVAADSITTAKLAPGSVTLSKLAFEVPNLNELENEINARKAAEASVKAAQAEAAAAGAKNDAAITAAAANGITQEAAARTAADEDLAKKTAAADADLLSKLNTEVKDRGAADDVLQSKLNTEIADRAGAINNLRSELGNANQVAAPIVQINNNEIVKDAVTTDKIYAETILAEDLATGSVTTSEILDDTVAAIDLANGAVVGRAAGETLTNVKAETLRGERTANGSTAESTGDLAIGTITGENDNDTTRTLAVGNLGLKTVGRNNLVDNSVDGTKIEVDTITNADVADDNLDASSLAEDSVDTSEIKVGAVKSEEIGDGEVTTIDIADQNVTTLKLEGSDTDALTTGVTRAITAATLADGAVINRALGVNAVTTDKIALNTIRAEDVSIDDALNLRGNNIGRETITGEGDNDTAAGPKGNLGLATVGRGNLVLQSVDTAQLADNAVNGTKIATGTVTGQGNNNTSLAISGDLAEKTVGRKNIVDEAIDATKIDTAFHGTLVTEGEWATRLAAMKADDSGTANDFDATGVKAPNDGDGFLHWNHLEGIPDTILEADGKVNTLRKELKDPDAGGVGGVAANDGDGLVHFTNIDGVVITSSMLATGSVEGIDILDNTITAADLAGEDENDPATPDNDIRPGAVNTEKILDYTILERDLATGVTAPVVSANIRDQSITAQDLYPDTITGGEIQDGSVTTEELLANAQGPDLETILDVPTTGTLAGATLVANLGDVEIELTNDFHKVLVTGQGVVTCTTCDDPADVADAVVVTWTLVDQGDVLPIEAPVYSVRLDATDRSATIPVNFLVKDAPGGKHLYQLRLVGSNAAESVSVSDVALTAVDLGRTTTP